MKLLVWAQFRLLQRYSNELLVFYSVMHYKLLAFPYIFSRSLKGIWTKFFKTTAQNVQKAYTSSKPTETCLSSLLVTILKSLHRGCFQQYQAKGY